MNTDFDPNLKTENLSEDYLFEENRVLGGYNLKVLDNWGMKIKKRSVSELEKEAYIAEFGLKMITDDEFYEWWKNLNSLSYKVLRKRDNS